MAQHLIGMHDWDAAWARRVRDTGKTAWCTTTHELGDDPADQTGYDFRPMAEYGVTPIARLNYSHHGQGTIPLSDRYGAFAQRCSNFVRNSPGCRRWIIGNEPNRGPVEWPNGIPIHPAQYADCYLRCRGVIHGLPGHEQDEVLLAPIGPWNDELKYAGNPTGDWVQYFADVIRATGNQVDGFALHAYTHGYDPGLVTSEARMQPPFADRRYEFRTYRDFLSVIPSPLRERPVYLTEANGNGPWQARGLIPAMLREIDDWNKRGSPKVQCVIFYRYPRYDEYHIEGKADVIAEFERAAANSPQSPTASSSGGDNTPNSSVYIPVAPSGGVAPAPPASTLPPRQWDSRLTQRGVRVVEAQAVPGHTYWEVTQGRWFDESEAGGRLHIYVEARDEEGGLLEGVPFHVTWPSGDATEHTKRGGGFEAGNFVMGKSLNEYSVQIADGAPSDRVTGIGRGANGNPNIHTATLVVFQRTQAAQQPTTPPQTGTVTGPQPKPATVPALVHPVADARYRTVTQPFGVNEAYYRQYAVDGVPLMGHNGVDFGTPVGVLIVAVAAGRVVEVATESGGYGKYVKLSHPWGESLYAHLSRQDVAVGQQVQAGQRLGLSGDSGKATGPHLHFGLRVVPFNRRDGWGGYTDPSPHLSGQGTPPQPAPMTDLLLLIEAAAAEFGLEWQSVVAQVMAESSFNPNAASHKDARGLMQIVPSTWQEWAANLGIQSDMMDPAANLRVGCAYMRWLHQTLQGKYGAQAYYMALIAYGWGIGNLLAQKEEPPQEWRFYASNVLFGAELIKGLARLGVKGLERIERDGAVN